MAKQEEKRVNLDCLIKEDDSRMFEQEIYSNSSSDYSREPIIYTGEEPLENERITDAEIDNRRSGMLHGMTRGLQKTASRLSVGSRGNQETTSVHNYSDTEEEITLRRTNTIRSILQELDQRAEGIEQDWLTGDEEKTEKDLERQEEVLPSTAVPTENNGMEFQELDPDLVTWDGSNDTEHPRNWPQQKKLYLLLFVSLYTLVSPMSSSMPSPAIDDISKQFDIRSSAVSAMVISIQILAWAIGPLVISPLSEYDTFGRKPILDLSIWMSFFFNIGCAFSKNTAQILIFRFIGGLFGSTPLNVGAGVISDLYDAKSRNSALAAFSLAPLLGPVLAPVVSGFVSQNLQWRWVFYILCMFNGAIALLGTIFYRETFPPKLLKRKARLLRKQTGNKALHTIHEITNEESILQRVLYTMTKPIKLLFTHPMIIGLGSFMAFTYGFMYLMIVTFPTIYREQYGYSKGITGLLYVPMGIGFVLGVLFWTVLIDLIYQKLTARNNGIPKPEFRLPCLCFSGVGICIGLIWYGWSVQKHLHWIMPSIGSAIFAFAFIAVFQTIQNYLIDMNPAFAASSVAAAAVFRSMLGFAMPIVATPMYDRLTYGWGNTLCGIIALVLGTPFPLFCYYYGERVRNWANRRIELKQLHRDRKILQSLQKI